MVIWNHLSQLDATFGVGDSQNCSIGYLSLCPVFIGSALSIFA